MLRVGLSETAKRLVLWSVLGFSVASVSGCAKNTTVTTPGASARRRDCGDCGLDDYCQQEHSGTAREPGESAMPTLCKALPQACWDHPTCACLQAQPSFSNRDVVGCDSLPGGLLRLTIANP